MGVIVIYRFKYPSQVSLEITNKCNFECEHCINNSGIKEVSELSYDKIKEIIDYMNQRGIVCLDFSGGEPLLHNDFEKILKYAYINNMNISVASNGYLLNDKVLELLKKTNSTLRISYDGPNEQIYSLIRGPHKYEVVKNNIIKAVNNGIVTNLVVVLHKGNLNYLEQIIEDAKTFKVNKLRLMPYVRIGRGKKSDLEMLTTDDWRYLIENHKKMSEKSGVEIAIDSPLMAITEKGTCPCLVGKLCLVIKSNGDAIPCALLNKVVGNIYNETIEEIWKNKIFDEINDTSKLKEDCRICKYREECSGGCRGLAYTLKGDYLCKDPYCWITNQNK